MVEFELKEMTKEDLEFIYELLKEYFKTDFSVTILTLPPFDDYFKTYFENDLKTYIVMVNKRRTGFVHITKSGEIGYYMLKEYQNKGIAINAVKEMIKLHPRERYFATVNMNNERSKNLVKKLGFQPKGVIYEKLQR